MNPIGEIISGGNLLLALPIALAAGLVSFASPCILPLVPGYLAYVGGVAGDGRKRDRRRLLPESLCSCSDSASSTSA